MALETERTDKERLYVLLARYQLGLLSEEEKEEMNALQKKLYGDSTLYREPEYEKLACAPKKGESFFPVEEKAGETEEEKPRIVEEKPGPEEESFEELFGGAGKEPTDSQKKKKIEMDLEEI